MKYARYEINLIITEMLMALALMGLYVLTEHGIMPELIPHFSVAFGALIVLVNLLLTHVLFSERFGNSELNFMIANSITIFLFSIVIVMNRIPLIMPYVCAAMIANMFAILVVASRGVKRNAANPSRQGCACSSPCSGDRYRDIQERIRRLGDDIRQAEIASRLARNSSMLRSAKRRKAVSKKKTGGAKKRGPRASRRVTARKGAAKTLPRDNIFIASKNRKKLHKATCVVASNIPKENRLVFSNAERAVKEGFSPCKLCFLTRL
ncbi:TPA: hypothetical protein HA317_00820 [Candidatus Woesearchaeota archaeon]|nr:hypothetical protein [Candidatus Woesearchaeota archaeon]